MDKIVVMGLALSMLTGCPTQEAVLDVRTDASFVSGCGVDRCASQPGTVCCVHRDGETCEPEDSCINCIVGSTTQDTRRDAFVDFDAGCFAR